MAVGTAESPVREQETVWQDDPRRFAAAIRAIHHQIDPPPGWRVEIIEGQIVVSAAPTPARAYIIEIVRTAVAGTLPPRYGAYENIGFEEPEIDRYIPDLSVWPRQALRSAIAQPRPGMCELAVEVAPPQQSESHYAKAEGYARCGIPVYLIVDQTDGICVVFTEPEDGTYKNRHQEPFGKPVSLPLEPPVTLDTSDF